MCWLLGHKYYRFHSRIIGARYGYLQDITIKTKWVLPLESTEPQLSRDVEVRVRFCLRGHHIVWEAVDKKACEEKL